MRCFKMQELKLKLTIYRDLKYFKKNKLNKYIIILKARKNIENIIWKTTPYVSMFMGFSFY